MFPLYDINWYTANDIVFDVHRRIEHLGNRKTLMLLFLSEILCEEVALLNVEWNFSRA